MCVAMKKGVCASCSADRQNVYEYLIGTHASKISVAVRQSASQGQPVRLAVLPCPPAPSRP